MSLVSPQPPANRPAPGRCWRRQPLFAMAVLALACDTASTERGARHAAPAPSQVASKAVTSHTNPMASAEEPAAPSDELAMPVPQGLTPDADVRLTPGGSEVVRGRHGLVTSVEPQATRVGIRILEQGGNAVDAAIAVAFALSVTHPSAASLGGGGFMLVATAEGVRALDFRETAPQRLPKARFDAMIQARGRGAAAVGVPGMVAGLSLAHRRLGSLEWRELLEPAVSLASRGYSLGNRQQLSLSWNWPHLKQQAEFVTRFGAPQGARPLPAGSKVTRPVLASTLTELAARGAPAFYRGPIAAKLLEDLGQEALLTRDDFESYRAYWRTPLMVPYRGLAVMTMPPPSAGGVALTQTLLMLEGLRAQRFPHNSPEALHLLVEAAKRAHAERRFSVIDPDAWSPAELERRRTRWLSPRSLVEAHPIALLHATPSSKLHPLYTAAAESEHTTHFSVVDESGMAVSCTITLSAGFGAKLLSKHTGIIVNNAVASFSNEGENLPTGGRRTTSSMTPTLVFRGNRLGLVLGSPGGDTIPNSVVQVLRNVVDYGMTIDRAVQAPRIHHGFIPDAIRYERARPIPAKTRAALAKLGHTFSKNTTPIGDANSILLDDTGAYGIADPREGGLALAAAPARPASSTPAPSARP